MLGNNRLTIATRPAVHALLAPMSYPGLSHSQESKAGWKRLSWRSGFSSYASWVYI